MKNIVLFASGNGSNAENIVRYFSTRQDVAFPLLLCNKRDAYVFERARNLNIPSRYIGREEFKSEDLVRELQHIPADLIVLAGFLWLMPPQMINAFPKRILNIHPALLPKFGGKGMYGEKVHEAVIAAGEKESGITIHAIDADYDRGTTVFQAKCPVTKEDTAETLANKVHQLEYAYYPEIIDKYLQSL